MNETLSILVMVGGGLGTFLLGMKHLSEGLQAVSGSGLRKFMSLATTHRLAGVRKVLTGEADQKLEDHIAETLARGKGN